MDEVGVKEWELEAEDGVGERLKGCRRLRARGLGQEAAEVGADEDFAIEAGGRAVVSRIMGEEPTLDTGEYSLEVVDLGADAEEFEDTYDPFVEDELLAVAPLSLQRGSRSHISAVMFGKSWEVESVLSSGTAMGTSSPSSVMRTERRGSGKGAKRIRRCAAES
jgi:hypothetical protein